MTTVEFLKSARALITDKSKWCTNSVAKTADGESVVSRHPKAVQWCAVGALGHFYDGNSVNDVAYDTAASLLRETSLKLYHSVTSLVNDQQGHEAILKVFDEAINLANSPKEPVDVPATDPQGGEGVDQAA